MAGWRANPKRQVVGGGHRLKNVETTVFRAEGQRLRQSWFVTGKRQFRENDQVCAAGGGLLDEALVQLACSRAPDGRERWTLQLLADKLIKLEVVTTVSYETVRTTLNK